MIYYKIMQITYKKSFAQFVKKSKRSLQLTIEDEVEKICKKPELGKQKIGDLKDVFVHKFHFNQQEYLMAYQFSYETNQLDIVWIDFYQVGSHENFYTQLKKVIRLI